MMANASRRIDWMKHGRRWKFLLLLLPGYYTASMDLTIVATAQPFIASHFRESPHAAKELLLNSPRGLEPA